MQEGLFIPLYAQGDVYAFARVVESEIAVVIVNRGGEVGLELDLTRVGLEDEVLTSFFTGETHKVENGLLSLTPGACMSGIFTT